MLLHHSVAADNTIIIYEAQTFSCKFILQGHEKGVNAVAWSSDSRYLASCSDDKTIRIWNCEKVSFLLSFHCSPYWCALSVVSHTFPFPLHIIPGEASLPAVAPTTTSTSSLSIRVHSLKPYTPTPTPSPISPSAITVHISFPPLSMVIGTDSPLPQL